jgi:glycosyltransferase involved in cell wall biosynthesis
MKKDLQKLHVVYLGETGFPYGLAAIQKMTLVSKALVRAGARVAIVNRKGKFDPAKPRDLAPAGEHEGIHYVYTSGTIYRPKGFIARNWQKVTGQFREFRYLRQLRKQGRLDAGIISSHRFGLVCLYLLYSWMLRFPVVLNYVEWTRTMEHRRGFWKRISDILYDKYLVKRMDAALPISELLMTHYRELAPRKPAMKLPIICDFELFNLPKRGIEEPYFLYCGSLSYREVIDFILEAYDQLPAQPLLKLKLVVSGGKKSEYEQFHKDLQQYRKAAHIEVYANIPYDQLVDLYLHASALLIPLRPTLQDAARFPHKIGEYLAAGNPIVTTNHGEIVHYFKNEETALIAEHYDVPAFAERMRFVMDHPEKARNIGKKGREMGLREFDYVQYGPRLVRFLEKLTVKYGRRPVGAVADREAVEAR